ncbi:hypothetical protein ACQSSU_20770 [Micromonospora echinospora]
MTWRYLARRAVTGEWLDWDVPLVNAQPSWALSASGQLTGSIDPDVGQLRASDGQLLLQEQGTLLYAEAAGQLRWAGILVHSRWQGSEWRVEAAGLGSYPHGIPFVGEFSQVGVDPLHAVRIIWQHLQSFPGGNLGVLVDSTASPVRLGKPAVAAYDEVQINGVWVPKSSVPAAQIEPSAEAKLKTSMDSDDTQLTLAALGAYGQLTPPYLITIGKETLQVGGRSGTRLTGLVRGHGSSSPSGHNAGTLVKHTGTPTRTVAAQPAEPYTLAWWDAPDCGQEIDRLCRETPFDWAEEVAWGADGVPVHRIRLGYPRLGRRRDDLAFVQGDNVVNVVPVQRSGDDIANEVLGLGAGEGRSMVHTRLPIVDGRLRRVAVLTDKTVTSGSRIDALARDELLRRRGLLDIAELEVVDHPNAPIGSWASGDDILVQATVPWLGDLATWFRVVSWTLLGEHRAKLALDRSDHYVYGGTW